MSKKCLLIGASGGIGSETAKTLAAQNFQVTLHYHSNQEAVMQLKHQLPEGLCGGVLQGDLATENGIKSFINKLDQEWDVVVFCGGHTWQGLFQEMALEVMNKLYYVHVQSVWRITQHLLPQMIRNKHGNIVVVSSVFGEVGASTEVAYSAVKGAQLSFVKSLAKEVAPSGIRVNAVTPGLIKTKMNEQLNSEEWKAIVEDVPLGRAGTPAEIAQSIGYLVSDQASYITGHVLQVNGGWS